MPRKARNLLGQELEGAPALGGELALRVRERVNLIGDALGVPAVRDPCEPLELGVRQAKRLADIANRTSRAIRREAGHERCVLVAVALGHPDDELLPDVRGKSRSMSGTEAISRFRNRPSESSFSTGSTWERPVR